MVESRVGGIPELVADGVTGLLLEPGNPLALATALVHLLAHAEERASMGRAGLQRIQQIAGFEANIAQRLRVYQQVLDEFAAGNSVRTGRAIKAMAPSASEVP